ncbi:hypothetical protein HYZ76_00705 [Candidatus Falkowbacteria bacterium]|nr:hypothetical protein [Candidatus Falkowbacteria bacterium]
MCGIIGISGKSDAVNAGINALLTIHGRGDQGSGIAGPVDGKIITIKGKGEITNIKTEAMQALGKCTAVLAHCRYGTAGKNLIENVQPFVSDSEQLAIAHNGQIVGSDEFRSDLEKQGVIFQSTSDSEVVLKLFERAKGDNVITKVLAVLNSLDRAYALAILWNGYLIGACDRHGYHPLTLGHFAHDGGGHIIASEDVAFGPVGAVTIRDVKPGQVVIVSPEQDVSSYRLDNIPKESKRCSFNLPYTARPDSRIWGRSVSKVRKRLGVAAFEEMRHSGILPVIDVISPVLDSGRTATLAFANAYTKHRIMEIIRHGGLQALERIDLDSLFPHDYGINRAHHRRNFQLDDQNMRDFFIMLKHGVDRAVVNGKRVLIGDDTVVRSTTARRIIVALRQFGATEVHWVSFAPPILASCPYGGTETRDESLLIAAHHTTDEIADIIGADSLYYLSLERYQSIIDDGPGYCFACMLGHNNSQ